MLPHAPRLIFPSPRSQLAGARGLPRGIPQILPQRACSQRPGEEAESKTLSGGRDERIEPTVWGGASGCALAREGVSQKPKEEGSWASGLPVFYWADQSGPSDLGLGESPILRTLLSLPTKSAVCKN